MKRLLSQQRLSICRQLSTVSRQEVNKFSAMDSQWWDPVQNPLVSMNPIRLQFIERAVMDFSDFTCSPKQSLDGMSALDIGCGGGLLSESLAQLGAATTGLDPSEALIKAAKDHAERNLPRESLERLQYVNTRLEE